MNGIPPQELWVHSDHDFDSDSTSSVPLLHLYALYLTVSCLLKCDADEIAIDFDDFEVRW